MSELYILKKHLFSFFHKPQKFPKKQDYIFSKNKVKQKKIVKKPRKKRVEKQHKKRAVPYPSKNQKHKKEEVYRKFQKTQTT